MLRWGRGLALSALAGLISLAAPAVAQESGRVGQSAPRQLDLQTPATPMAEQVGDLHHLMLVISTAIVIFVLALLLIVIVRFNKSVNKTPAKWTHNTPLEVVWTIAPILILVVVALPSIRLLQSQEDFSKVEPDIVIKATGYQWYWGYSYPDVGIEEFEGRMLGLNKAKMDDDVRAELAEYGYSEKRWKLATDTAVVVPVNKTVLMQITAADVIHSWTIPSFGVKADGVPGRLNQTWFKPTEIGTYFGQCSELCGAYHAYMPITVKVVDQATYDAWVACAKENGGGECPTAPTDQVSSAASKKRLAQVER